MRGPGTWIRSARADTCIALAWVPFALAVGVIRNDGHALVVFLGALSLFSFVHQPLTLPLVYGDSAQFEARRRVFVWAPLALAGAIWLGLTVSFLLVAVIGGLWNMEHTLMQRYGFARIYGRKSGQDDGRLERVMLLSWLAVTLLSVAADARTPDRIASLPLGQLNRDGLNVLASFRPFAGMLLVPALAIGGALTIRWLTAERQRTREGRASAPKRLYLGSTAVMFLWAIVVDPVGGLAGYAGAHALEYFFIVDHRLASTRSLWSRRRFFAGYLTAFALLYLVMYPTNAWTACVLFFGGLHFLFDGFIWKQRRPLPAEPVRQSMPAKVSA